MTIKTRKSPPLSYCYASAHRIFPIDDWVNVVDLNAGDMICTLKGSCFRVDFIDKRTPDTQVEVILGMECFEILSEPEKSWGGWKKRIAVIVLQESGYVFKYELRAEKDWG